MDFKNVPENQFIEIFLSATIVNQNIISKPSTYVKIKYKLQGEEEIILGKTETVKSNLSPFWETSFKIDYQFELLQNLTFEVYNHDNKFLGMCKTTVGNLVGSKNNANELQFFNKLTYSGILNVVINKIVDPNTIIQMQIEGENLKNVAGLFGTSNPFLKFFKQTQGGLWVLAHKTEVKQKNLSPSYDKIEISTMQLCNGNINQEFKVECWDFQNNGSENILIGAFQTNLNIILSSQLPIIFTLKQDQENRGEIKILQCKKIYNPTFIDYIHSGEQINAIIGVNYTLHNGDLSFPDSLHKLCTEPNHYEDLILKATRILLQYDYDSRIAIFGFGGIPHLSEQVNFTTVNQCFPLTGDFSNPEVQGCEDLINLYRKTLMKIEFKGIIIYIFIFIKILGKFVLQYSIAKILRKQTHKKTFIRYWLYSLAEISLTFNKQFIQSQHVSRKFQQNLGNRTAISILIVGIGDFDFSEIESLNQKQKENQQRASFEPCRDIVKYVNYHKYQFSPVLLQREMLRGLPYQFELYKQLNGIMPNQKEQS